MIRDIFIKNYNFNFFLDKKSLTCEPKTLIHQTTAFISYNFYINVYLLYKPLTIFHFLRPI